MSVQPPPLENSRSVPGYIIVLASFSVLVLLLAVGAGLVAFGVVDIGGNDDPPQAPMADGPIQSSGFSVLDQRQTDDRAEVDISFSVTNTSDDVVENATVMVQCLDGGNVSSKQLIVSIGPDETQTYELTLVGTGDPGCGEPSISVDIP